jgi:hypothetical protein
MALFSRLATPGLPQGRPAARLQRVCACAARGPGAQGDCAECDKKKRLQRKSAAGTRLASAAQPAWVADARLSSGGFALPAPLRAVMEPAFGCDFGHVRLHDDAQSHQATREVDAHAFTLGSHIHFARGQFSAGSPRATHLLAHELAHTVQQRHAAAPGGAPLEIDRPDSPQEREADHAAERVMRHGSADAVASAGVAHARVQRVSVGEFFSRLFSEGTFSDAELQAYLQYLDDHAAIEGSYDSDNKARAIIRRWRAGDAAFTLNLPRKQLMLLELIDGPTLDDDEHAILELLRGSTPREVLALLATAGGEEALKGEFHGSESDELDQFLADWHADPSHRAVAPAELGRRGVTISEIVVNQETPQTVTVRYNDGRVEAETCSAGKGTCCVEPGSDAAPSTAQTHRTDSNWTPLGSFRVTLREAMHHDIAWWTQFHARGIALHQYAPVDGTPLSHGCVRLNGGIAERIYRGSVVGRTVVRVTGDARPRCDHAALMSEWARDFRGARPADGEADAETRRHLRLAYGGVGDAELDRRIAAREVPRCGAGRPRSR